MEDIIGQHRKEISQLLEELKKVYFENAELKNDNRELKKKLEQYENKQKDKPQSKGAV